MSLIPNKCSHFIKVDHDVIGALALDDDGAMLDYSNMRNAKAVMQKTHNAMLVTVSTKFTLTTSLRFGHLSGVDVFATEQIPLELAVAYCKNNGVRLEIVPEHAVNDFVMDAEK